MHRVPPNSQYKLCSHSQQCRNPAGSSTFAGHYDKKVTNESLQVLSIQYVHGARNGKINK